MRSRRYLVLLLPLALLSSGFTWGLGKGDGCGEANKSIAGISPDTPPTKRMELEKKSSERCPEGAAAEYLKGIRLESEKKMDQAIAAYRSAAAKEPGLADAHGRLGLLLLEKGDREQASVELMTALQSRPTPAYARAVGEIFLEGKLNALALHFFRQALPSFAADPAFQLEMGQAHLALDSSSQALPFFQEALRLNPGGAAPHLGLAACYRQQKNYGAAIGELRLALAADSGNRELHFELAQLLELAGKGDEAEREYRQAGVERALGPTDYLKKAADYAAAGAFDLAAASYGALLLKEPDLPGVREKLGDARMAAGQDLEAIRAYEEAIRRREGNSAISYNLGILHERNGNLDEAVGSLQDAIRLDPENGDARRRLAEIHALRGAFAEAIEQYRELISRHDTNPLSYYKLARLLEKQRDYTGAAEAYTRAVGLDGNNVEAHRELAFLLIKKKLPGDPAQELREVLRLRPNDKEARYALVTLCVKGKRYDETTALLKEDVALNPENPESHYRLGVMEVFRHQDDEARSSFQEAIRLKPDHARALKALGKLYLKAGEREKARAAFAAAHRADPLMQEPIELSNRLVPASQAEAAPSRKAKRSLRKKGGEKHGSKATRKAGGHRKVRR